MSFYNMINGMNATLAMLLSPFLPIRADKFPRFRDIFLGDDEATVKGDIYIYTRMGGGNRECWNEGPGGAACECSACEADLIEANNQCVSRYDDDFDCTFCTFVFNVLDEDKNDFLLVTTGKIKETSDKYKTRLKEMFSDSEKITSLIKEVLKEGENE
jgi:hypothetical protein